MAKMTREEFIARYGIGPGGTFLADNQGGNAASEVSGLSAADYYDRFLADNAAKTYVGADGNEMPVNFGYSGEYSNINPTFDAWDNVNPHPESQKGTGWEEAWKAVGKPVAMAAALYGGVNALGSMAGAPGAASGAAGSTAGGGAAGAGSDFGIGTYAGTGAIPATVAPEAGLLSGTGLSGGSATKAALYGASGYGPAVTAAEMGTGGLGAVGQFLKDNPTLTQIGGALLGAAAGGDKTVSASSTKDPWGPAQQYLKDNLASNAAMQDYYSKNPFSDLQKSSYQGLLDANATGMANVSGLLSNASNFGKSSRGVMPSMQGLLEGVTAPPVDWSQYTAWRK